MVKVIGVSFKGPHQEGDFTWMIEREQYGSCLFIFNDNEMHHNTNIRGGGNAAVRPYNKHNKQLEKPRSAGIPTGTMMGYDSLSTAVKGSIDSSIEEIKELLRMYHYETIYYSIDSKTGKLGTGIFRVNPDVIDYIDQQINGLVST